MFMGLEEGNTVEEGQGGRIGWHYGVYVRKEYIPHFCYFQCLCNQSTTPLCYGQVLTL